MRAVIACRGLASETPSPPLGRDTYMGGVRSRVNARDELPLLWTERRSFSLRRRALCLQRWVDQWLQEGLFRAAGRNSARTARATERGERWRLLLPIRKNLHWASGRALLLER